MTYMRRIRRTISCCIVNFSVSGRGLRLIILAGISSINNKSIQVFVIVNVAYYIIILLNIGNTFYMRVGKYLQQSCRNDVGCEFSMTSK